VLETIHVVPRYNSFFVMSKKRRSAQKKQPRPWLGPVLLLVVLAFGVYANSLANGFVGDDEQQLLQNPVVSGHRLAAAFTSGVWAFRGAKGNYYRPLQFVFYALMHAIFGFQALGFHLAMVVLHAANTVLVYFLAMRLAARPRMAWAAGAVFALHPIHTEAVDWIAALPDVMTCTIVLLAVWRFARAGGAARGWETAAHCALYLAALLTKETGVMLLPLYLGMERICLARPVREMRNNLALYGAMLATLAGYAVLRWAALGGLAPAQQTFHQLTPWEFMLSAVVTAAQYAGKLILPTGLNYFHIFQATRSITPAFLISLAILAAMGIAACYRAIPSTVRYGIFWMAITLAPAMNLTGVGQNVFAERYLYLPSVGLAWIAGLVWERWEARQARLAWVAGVAILCAGGWQSMARNDDWRDNFTLLRKTVAQSPGAGILHNNLAGAYLARKDLDHALEQERLAAKLEPLSQPFHKNLGLLLMMARDPRAAIPEFEEALRLQPGAADVQGLLEEARAAAARQ
jgi:hypothetical protein